MSDFGKPQAILCDRDGTLIQDKHFLSHPEQIEWIPGVLEAIQFLNAEEIKVLVLTNQSGVARGYFGLDAVEAVHRQLRRDVEEVSGAIADFYYCPHHPNGEAMDYSFPCDCRKPSPGMFLQAIRDHDLNPSQCWVIGDRLRDLEPGLQLGMKAFLVETGSGEGAQQELSQRPYRSEVNVISSMAGIIAILESIGNFKSPPL